MSETKIERKAEGGESAHKTADKRAKNSWRQRLEGIFRPVFTLGRLRSVGLGVFVCVISIILFLTLKGGKNNDRH